MSKYELKNGFSWATFESIENDLLRIVEYIPLETRQYQVYSFQLSDIIKNSCSQIDSIFKEISRQCNLSDYPDKKKLKKYRDGVNRQDRSLSILDHADVFSNYFNLQNMEIIIRRNFDSLEPFKVFTKDKSPSGAINQITCFKYFQSDVKSQGRKRECKINSLEKALFLLLL